MRFNGKSILVTGAASGIGKAVAELLASEGAGRLVLVDSDREALEGLKIRCAADRLAGDVSDPAFWSTASFDELDHAVINAGVAGAAVITDLESKNGAGSCR